MNLVIMLTSHSTCLGKFEFIKGRFNEENIYFTTINVLYFGFD